MILLQNAIFGLLIGGLYGLGAVGLSLVFGVLRMLNVSHGELIMLGGYASFWLFTLWRGGPFLFFLVAGPGGVLLGRVLFCGPLPHFVPLSPDQKEKNTLFIRFRLVVGLSNTSALVRGRGCAAG